MLLFYMEQRGGKRHLRTDGHLKTNSKPMTPAALAALPGELDRWAALGQREMRRGSGITLPSRRGSTRVLRNGGNHR